MTRKIWHALASPLVIIPPLAVWFLVGLVTYAMPLNSLRLRWMERNVLRWEHPEDSRLLARHSELGRFGGGSADFCEFWAGELRQSSLHGEELVNFYRSQRGEDVVLVGGLLKLIATFRRYLRIPLRFGGCFLASAISWVSADFS